jgi:hypothetical protein
VAGTPKTKVVNDHAQSNAFATDAAVTQLGSGVLQANSTFGGPNLQPPSGLVNEFKTGLEKPGPTDFPQISGSSYNFDQKKPESDYRNRKRRSNPREEFGSGAVDIDKDMSFPKSPLQ